MGPTDSDCKADFNKACTNSLRLSTLGKTAAHELGHTLGMDHDFDNKVFRASNHRTFKYRTYKGKSCKGGLMSYKEPRKGWSTCSQRDFSRYLTSGGTKKPCTFGSKIKDNRKLCKNSCNGAFKRCVNHAGYSQCASNLASSDSRRNLTPDCAVNCKPNKKMIALKSK